MTCKVNEPTGGETVKVNVSIEEEEYDKACRDEVRGDWIPLISHSISKKTYSLFFG